MDAENLVRLGENIAGMSDYELILAIFAVVLTRMPSQKEGDADIADMLVDETIRRITHSKED